MSNSNDRSEARGGVGFVVGLMAGTIFGVGLGMLLAPRAGSELRGEIGTRARQAGNRLAEEYKQAGEKATKWTERGKEVAQRGRNAVDRGREVVSRGIEEARRYAKSGPAAPEGEKQS